ncbi:MAG: hypothetical protein EXR35_03745 [Limnohabitans sp.]|nr:hypothetical protein [Limnohabitans sp.]
MSDTDQINGMLLRLKREEHGWAFSDMATSACLSVKQVKQIEEGGMSAFYSPTVKLTAAKKMAHLLGVSEDELLGRIASVAPSVAHEEFDGSPPLASALGFRGETAAPVFRSHDLHELAQPPEHRKHDAADDNEAVSVHLNENSTETSETTETSDNHLIKIIALFVLALAGAAYFSQQQNNTEKTEAPTTTPELVPPVAPAASTEAPATSVTTPAPGAQTLTKTVQTPAVMTSATTSPVVTAPPTPKPNATPDTSSKP